MKKTAQIVIVLLVVAVVAGVIFKVTRPDRQGGDEGSSGVSTGVTQRSGVSGSRGGGEAAVLPEGAPTKSAALRRASEVAAQGAAAAAREPVAAGGAAADEDGQEGETPQERAVAAWDKLIDGLSEERDEGEPALPTPTYDLMQRVRSAFYRMAPDDRQDNMHHTLNLLPDDQFSSLYAILFDKGVDADILDDIFSDALNRADEIKIPLMKELMKDEEHPCHEEAVRILDATGELDEEDEE